MIGMMYDSVKHRRDHERQVVLLARIIEVRGGDDDENTPVCKYDTRKRSGCGLSRAIESVNVSNIEQTVGC